MSETKTAGEHRFEANVSQILDIVIHSLYSHPEIFVRELISNAADAIDKLRVRSLTEHDLAGGDQDYKIELIPDVEGQTLTIRDNGIGMSEDELVENLGTIAHSGSKKFLEALKEKDAGENVDLIGQFGVGFYSAFLVANRVEVTSCAAGSKQGSRWSSEAQGTYSVELAEGEVSRGTSIKLFLKEDKKEFLEEFRLRTLVRQYSDFLQHPILLEIEREEGEGDDKKKEKKFERLNQGTALWKRPKGEITDEQYEEFYKHVTHDFEAPLARNHFTVEGTQLFTGLLFLPKNPPFDLFQPSKRRGVRLYVKRVFIMDDCEELIPEWLRFVRGIVDSDDLPLNVSRELLQEDRIVKTIRKVVTRKVLESMEELAKDREDDYKAFWQHFGAVVKEGLHYDPDHKEALAKLVRYDSSKEDGTSLEAYVERMPEDQKAIYYVIAPDRKTAESSPHIEALLKKDYEVLYMTDAVDEWAVTGMPEFAEKPLVSAMKANLNLEGEDGKEDEKSEHEVDPDMESFKDRIQRVLEEDIAEVKVSNRLTDSPACLVTPEGGLHSHIERMVRARQQGMPATKRIFEINPDHPIIQRMRSLHLEPDHAEDADDWVRMLHDQALLAEGSPISDPAGFARRMSSLMTKVLGSDESGSEASA